jgi:DinB superfamily
MTRKRTRAVVSSLIQQIDEAYDVRSWHGTNLRGSLRGLSPKVAAWRPGPGRHNIWELAVHAAYWKYAVRRLLRGGPRGAFPLKGSNWFVRPTAVTAAAWRADLALLSSEHRQLRSAIRRLEDADLARPAGKGTVGFLLRGIAAHDLYHAGQIQVLKRLCPR